MKGEEVLGSGRRAGFVLEVHPISQWGNPRDAEAVGAKAPLPLVGPCCWDPGWSSSFYVLPGAPRI